LINESLKYQELKAQACFGPRGFVRQLKETNMSIDKKTVSKRELVEPHKGDKRYVRCKADGTFGKTVDVYSYFQPTDVPKPRRRFLPARGTGAIPSNSLLDNAVLAEC
jgi:hypothetical protein